MLMPLGNALLPLLLKESVYLMWVIKEVLQIAAPGQEKVEMGVGQGHEVRGAGGADRRDFFVVGRRVTWCACPSMLAVGWA